MYEITTEYDGKEVLTIKSSIQYQIALCGSIKKDKPEFSEINQILNEAPNHTGIWIEKNSRKNFLEILKKITNATYKIDEAGYLTQISNSNMNKNDKAIKDMLLSDNLYVFDMSSKTYVVDVVTNEIQEYPFEEMDPEQGYEYFESDNKYLFIISQNNYGKINQEATLEEIFGSLYNKR